MTTTTTTTTSCPYAIALTSPSTTRTKKIFHNINNNNNDDDDNLTTTTTTTTTTPGTNTCVEHQHATIDLLGAGTSRNIGSSSSSSSKNSSSTSTSTTWLMDAVRRCPAFDNGTTCPFKNAKSAHDVQQTLLRIPQSHYYYDEQYNNNNNDEEEEQQGGNEKTSSSSSSSSSSDSEKKNSSTSNVEAPVAFYEVLREMHRVINNTTATTTKTSSTTTTTGSSCSSSSRSSTGNNRNTTETSRDDTTSGNNNNNNSHDHNNNNNSNGDDGDKRHQQQKHDYYAVPGGCPVHSIMMIKKKQQQQQQRQQQEQEKSHLQQHQQKSHQHQQEEEEAHSKHYQQSNAMSSFMDAMEGNSLAAIMAKLAEEVEQRTTSITTTVSSSAATVAATVAVATETSNNEKKETSTSTAATSTSSSSSSTSSSTNQTCLLSESLKHGTAVSHKAAEDVHFVRRFIRGEVDETSYKQLLVRLYHVYVALEDVLDQYAPQYFPTCHFPDELSRTLSLQRDMEYWYGKETWKQHPDVLTMSPATRDYVDRLYYLANNNNNNNKDDGCVHTRTTPLLLLAHSYTRYLGDLSGGRVLARVARRALKLGTVEQQLKANISDDIIIPGLEFYRFENIVIGTSTTITTTSSTRTSKSKTKPKSSSAVGGRRNSTSSFKSLYRECLDSIQLSREQINQLVIEANIAFGLNVRLFEELDVLAGNVHHNATVRPLSDIMNMAIKINKTFDVAETEAATAAIITKDESSDAKTTTTSTSSTECPFARMNKQIERGTATTKEGFGIMGIAATKHHHEQNKNSKFGSCYKEVAGGRSDHIRQRCPWPFILLHDPITGFHDIRTWFFIGGIIACYVWSLIVQNVTTTSSSSISS